jgi:cell wall-associated NlpC family hydrolase
MYAICHLSVVPVRKEPSDRSEMTTQLLLGDLVEILQEEGNWRLVRILTDGYTGWVDLKQLVPANDAEALQANDSPAYYCSSLVANALQENGMVQPVLLGSFLPNFKNGEFRIGSSKARFTGSVLQPEKPTKEGIERTAMSYLNAPYLWGGKSPFGIDCSGFTQMVFRLNGLSLPRDAWQQAETGVVVEPDEPANSGDLAFFENPEKRVVHVGIVLEDRKIIHASGQVRIDRLDEQGIIRTIDHVRTHRLCCVKRFF